MASTNRRFNRRLFSGTERPLTTAKESCLRTKTSFTIQTSSSTSYNTTKALASTAIYRNHKGIERVLHYANGTAVTLNLVTDSEQTFDVVAAGLVKQRTHKSRIHC